MQTKAQAIKGRAELGVTGSTCGKEGAFLEGLGPMNSKKRSPTEMKRAVGRLARWQVSGTAHT